MSRFMEQLNTFSNNGFQVRFSFLKEFTKELAERLGQQDANLEINSLGFMNVLALAQVLQV